MVRGLNFVHAVFGGHHSFGPALQIAAFNYSVQPFVQKGGRTGKQRVSPCAIIVVNQKQTIELSEELAALFFTYGQFGKELFEKKPVGWQENLLHKLLIH